MLEDGEFEVIFNYGVSFRLIWFYKVRFIIDIKSKIKLSSFDKKKYEYEYKLKFMGRVNL